MPAQERAIHTRSTGRRMRLSGWIGLWGLIVILGTLFAARFETRPGQPGVGAAVWPAGSSLPLAPAKTTLLLFAHPHCPCTRATLVELGRLLSRCGDRIAANIVVAWEGTDASACDDPDWKAALDGLEGVAVTKDVGASEARRFGVATSGEVLVYDPAGRLLFRGGITPARGHEGDSEGQEAIVRRVLDGATGKEVVARASSVFGCPLFAPGCVDRDDLTHLAEASGAAR